MRAARVLLLTDNKKSKQREDHNALLVKAGIPVDEASFSVNGKLNCLICFPRPMFDSIDQLTEHRQGSKHQKAVEAAAERKAQRHKPKTKVELTDTDGAKMTVLAPAPSLATIIAIRSVSSRSNVDVNIDDGDGDDDEEEEEEEYAPRGSVPVFFKRDPLWDEYWEQKEEEENTDDDIDNNNNNNDSSSSNNNNNDCELRPNESIHEWRKRLRCFYEGSLQKAGWSRDVEQNAWTCDPQNVNDTVFLTAANPDQLL